MTVLAQDRPQYESAELAMQKQVEPPSGGNSGASQAPDCNSEWKKGRSRSRKMLLFGTDLQPLLGFSLTVNVPGDNSCDLLKGSEPEETPANAIAGSKKEEAHEDKAPPTRTTLRKDAPPFVPESAIPPPGLMANTSQSGD